MFHVSKRFRRLTVLRMPCIDRLQDYYDVDAEKGLLGEGGFGIVYKGVCKRTGDQRAIKVIAKDRLKSYRQVCERMAREVGVFNWGAGGGDE